MKKETDQKGGRPTYQTGGVPSYVEQYQATQVEVSSPPKLFFILPG